MPSDKHPTPWSVNETIYRLAQIVDAGGNEVLRGVDKALAGRIAASVNAMALVVEMEKKFLREHSKAVGGELHHWCDMLRFSNKLCDCGLLESEKKLTALIDDYERAANDAK